MSTFRGYPYRFNWELGRDKRFIYRLVWSKCRMYKEFQMPGEFEWRLWGTNLYFTRFEHSDYILEKLRQNDEELREG